MKPEEFVSFLQEKKASAILRTPVGEAVAPAMDAAIRGGFRVLEVTLNTAGALAEIERLAAVARQRGDLVIGAGTVLSLADARSAASAGASFLVSPVVDEAVIDEARRLGVASMPGCYSPTELLRAHRAGATLQKLFPAPAELASTIRVLRGPMPFLRIVPTSGVTAENASACLAAGAHAVGFVATLFDPEDLAAGRFDRIEARAVELLARL